MKTRTLTSLAILIFASMLFASNTLAQKEQAGGDFMGGPPGSLEKLARISAHLDLSDQQELDMLAVLQSKEAKREALREQMHTLMGPEICALAAETEEEILAILDPTQAEQFLQQKAERQEKAQNRDRNHRRIGPPDCSEYESDAN